MRSERKPTVSVVIPAFNASPYLREALESVMAQTYQDFEIILIDDGSTDDTAEIAADYRPLLRYFHQENAGPAKARNRGIAEAKGKFVAFLDADDVWLPEKLEKQVRRFRAEPDLGLVTTGHQAFEVGRIHPPEKDKRKLLFEGGNVAKAIFVHSNVATPSVMVPRAVLDEIGGFEEEIHIGEDDNLWIRIAASYPVALVDEVLVRCRLRHDSLTRDGERFFEDVRKNILWLS